MQLVVIGFVLVIVLPILYRFYVKLTNANFSSKAPPTIMGWLPYGLDTTIQMAKSPVNFVYEARKKYGDIFSVYILGQFVTFVFSPKAGT